MFIIDDWIKAIWIAVSIVLCCMGYHTLVEDRIRVLEDRVRVIEDHIRVRKAEKKAILLQFNQ